MPGARRRRSTAAITNSSCGLTTWESYNIDGFVSANLHKSLDGKYVANYAPWRDEAAFRVMLANEQAKEHMGRAAALAEKFEPILYNVSGHSKSSPSLGRRSRSGLRLRKPARGHRSETRDAALSGMLARAQPSALSDHKRALPPSAAGVCREGAAPGVSSTSNT
jgi:hypothetical protein